MTYSKLHVSRLVTLHSIFGAHGIVSREHLDEGVALINIDDAGLDQAELFEDSAQDIFC